MTPMMKSRSRTTVLAIALAGLGLGLGGCGEPPGDDIGATDLPSAVVAHAPNGKAARLAAVAARHAYDRLVAGHPHLADAEVRFDPTFPVRRGELQGGAEEAAHPGDLVAEITRTLDALIGLRGEYVLCPQGPRSCEIQGNVVVVRLLEPILTGNAGRVNVELTYESTTLRPWRVYSSWLEVILEDIDGTWEVIGEGTREAT